MNTKNIYSELREKSIRSSQFFGRKLYIVSASDFEAYRPYFVETVNLLNDKKNYRTKDKFKHIHAVQTGSLIEFHYDFGNLYVSPLMIIPHFFLDAIPYFLYHLVTLKKPYKICEDANSKS